MDSHPFIGKDMPRSFYEFLRTNPRLRSVISFLPSTSQLLRKLSCKRAQARFNAISGGVVAAELSARSAGCTQVETPREQLNECPMSCWFEARQKSRLRGLHGMSSKRALRSFALEADVLRTQDDWRVCAIHCAVSSSLSVTITRCVCAHPTFSGAGIEANDVSVRSSSYSEVRGACPNGTPK